MALDYQQWVELAKLTNPQTIEESYRQGDIDSAHMQQLAIMGMHHEHLMLCKIPAAISGMDIAPFLCSKTGVVSMRIRNPIGNELEICNSTQPLLIQFIQLMPYISPEYADQLKIWSTMMDTKSSRETEEHPSFKRLMNGWLPF